MENVERKIYAVLSLFFIIWCGYILLFQSYGGTLMYVYSEKKASEVSFWFPVYALAMAGFVFRCSFWEGVDKEKEKKNVGKNG